MDGGVCGDDNMRVIDPGHMYALKHLDGEGEEILTCVKREGDKYPGNVGHYPGTNTQEGMRAYIERTKYVDNQEPCSENKQILLYLREIIFVLERRAARRHNRYFLLTHTERENIETLPICDKCGHIKCKGECSHVRSV